MTCTVTGCEHAAFKKGFCGSHYARERKYGDPLAGGTRRGELARWLNDHRGYDGNDCLIWPFGGKGNGYGHIRVNGKSTTAHRAMCALAHGEPEDRSMEAAHSCGNGHLGCVHPKHLRWATSGENGQDMVAHGRSCRGGKRATTKLTESDVVAIRNRLDGGESQQSIASSYGVTRGAVQGIQRGVSWKWLGVDVEDLRREGSLAA